MAISEAQIQLKRWRSKVARLMAAIHTFKENKAKGEPWPGAAKEGPGV